MLSASWNGFPILDKGRIFYVYALLLAYYWRRCPTRGFNGLIPSEMHMQWIKVFWASFVFHVWIQLVHVFLVGGSDKENWPFPDFSQCSIASNFFFLKRILNSRPECKAYSILDQNGQIYPMFQTKMVVKKILRFKKLSFSAVHNLYNSERDRTDIWIREFKKLLRRRRRRRRLKNEFIFHLRISGYS